MKFHSLARNSLARFARSFGIHFPARGRARDGLFDSENLSVAPARKNQGVWMLVWMLAYGPLVMLDQFLGRKSPYGVLVSANGVNNEGEIVGRGWDGKVYTAFVAVPM